MERVVNSMEANSGGTKPTVAKTITSLQWKQNHHLFFFKDSLKWQFKTLHQ